MKNQTLCQPTGEPVILLVDNLGVVTFKNPDNTPYTGDVSLLENCCCDVPHPPVVTNDSGSIDFTQSGTDNQTITAILTGADTATLDQFPASDGAGNIVWTSPLVTAARHDLRLVGTNLERGSDSATATNGAEFLHDGFSHLSGYSDNWIGSNGGSNPVMSLQNNGDTWYGASTPSNANNKMASHFNYANQSYILGNHPASTYNNIGVSSVVIGGRNGTSNTAYQITLGTGNISFTGNNSAMQLVDPLLIVGNGDGTNRNNAVTILKNGKTQFYNEPAGFSTRTQAQATPKSAMEVVSSTSGIILPQLTETQASARIAEINTTPSFTKALPGGWDDRIGETWFNLDLGTHERVIWNGTTYIKQTY